MSYCIDKESTKNLRNIIIFILGANIIGWIAMYFATKTEVSFVLQQILVITYIASPFLLALILRTIGKDGWKNSGVKFNFKQSKGWYAFSILGIPLILLINMIIAFIINGFSIEKEFINNLPAILLTSTILIIPKIIKNIGEEFGWRGYLEPQLKDIGVRSFLRHSITGFAWALWHLPIIFLTEYTNEAMITYLPRFFIGTIVFAFVYGELRYMSKTVWTSVLLHSVGNSFANTIYAANSLASHRYLGVTPESFVAMFCWGITALILWKIRVNNYNIKGGLKYENISS